MQLITDEKQVIDSTNVGSKKKLFVFDSTRGFACEVRKKFSSDYEITCCSRKKDLEKISYDDYLAGIIIINDVDEIGKLSFLKLKLRHLLVSTTLRKNMYSIPPLEDMVEFDLNLCRKETIAFFKEKFYEFKNP